MSVAEIRIILKSEAYGKQKHQTRPSNNVSNLFLMYTYTRYIINNYIADEVATGGVLLAFFSTSSGTFTVKVDLGPVFQVLSFSSTNAASTDNAYCPP